MVWLGSFFSRAPTAANDEDEDDDDDAVLPLPTAVPAAAVAEPNADIDEKTTTTSASRTGKGADEAKGELERSHCRVWQQHLLLFSFSHLPAAAVCLFSPSPVATTVYLSSRPTACLFSPPPTAALME